MAVARKNKISALTDDAMSIYDPLRNYLKLIFDSWGRVAARKLLILLVWGTGFSKV